MAAGLNAGRETRVCLRRYASADRASLACRPDFGGCGPVLMYVGRVASSPVLYGLDRRAAGQEQPSEPDGQDPT